MLRIGTWNVEYADNSATNARRRQVMVRNPADIWILTEARDALRPGVGFIGAHSVQRPYFANRVKVRSRWVSLWTRYPVVIERRLRVSDRERTIAVLVKTPYGRVIVFGTVFPWRGDVKRNIDRAIRAQLADIAHLRACFPNIPMCVAGDFNTDVVSRRHYLTIKAHEMFERALRRMNLYVATAPARIRPGRLASPPIDHIALPGRWKARAKVTSAWEGKVGTPRLSDHSGLVVRVCR